MQEAKCPVPCGKHTPLPQEAAHTPGRDTEYLCICLSLGNMYFARGKYANKFSSPPYKFTGVRDMSSNCWSFWPPA